MSQITLDVVGATPSPVLTSSRVPAFDTYLRCVPEYVELTRPVYENSYSMILSISTVTSTPLFVATTADPVKLIDSAAAVRLLPSSNISSALPLPPGIVTITSPVPEVTVTPAPWKSICVTSVETFAFSSWTTKPSTVTSTVELLASTKFTLYSL
jgi:hypothetical protein